MIDADRIDYQHLLERERIHGQLLEDANRGPADVAYGRTEDVLGRSELFADSVLTAKERGELFDGFLNRCRWVEVFYAWRPNLPDEADNHLIELGVAAQADAIVTRNLRDVARGELKFPSLRVLTPEQCLEVFPCLP